MLDYVALNIKVRVRFVFFVKNTSTLLVFFWTRYNSNPHYTLLQQTSLLYNTDYKHHQMYIHLELLMSVVLLLERNLGIFYNFFEFQCYEVFFQFHFQMLLWITLLSHKIHSWWRFHLLHVLLHILEQLFSSPHPPRSHCKREQVIRCQRKNPL